MPSNKGTAFARTRFRAHLCKYSKFNISMALFNPGEMGRVVVNAVATFVSLSPASLSASASTPISSTTTTSIPRATSSSRALYLRIYADARFEITRQT
jgi:hypothetical protein